MEAKLSQPTNLQAFEEYKNKALNDINEVIRLNNKIPYSYSLRESMLFEEGNSSEFEKALQEGIVQFPDYYGLYATRLESLEPKWGGSVDDMYDFVERYASGVTNDSPLKLLYLQLYADLLDTAWFPCLTPGRAQTSEVLKPCITSGMEKLVRPKLEGEVQTALDLYNHYDKHQAIRGIEHILYNMVGYYGGEAFVWKDFANGGHYLWQ